VDASPEDVTPGRLVHREKAAQLCVATATSLGSTGIHEESDGKFRESRVGIEVEFCGSVPKKSAGNMVLYSSEGWGTGWETWWVRLDVAEYSKVCG